MTEAIPEVAAPRSTDSASDDAIPPVLLDRPAAARALSVSDSTLRRLVHDGKLHPVHIGDRLLFAPADLTDYVERLRAERDASKKPTTTRRRRPAVGV